MKHSDGAVAKNRKPKAGAGALDISGYVPKIEMTLAYRGAHYLNWAADKFPGVYTPYNIMLQATQGYKRLPQLRNDEVDRLRNAIGRIREVLRRQYGRDLVPQTGVGVRATVDDADKLKNVLPGKVRRLKGAVKAVNDTAQAIDLSTVPNTPEMLPYKAWAGRELKDVIKQISSKEFDLKLLPPSTDPTKK
jgi:hypothetical protein